MINVKIYIVISLDLIIFYSMEKEIQNKNSFLMKLLFCHFVDICHNL